MPNLRLKMLWVCIVLSSLQGCSSVSKEPAVINVRPKAQTLNEQILQATQPDSTVLLKRVEEWLENSERLLNSGNDSSVPLGSN